jgi:hypothetical protein
MDWRFSNRPYMGFWEIFWELDELAILESPLHGVLGNFLGIG